MSKQTEFFDIVLKIISRWIIYNTYIERRIKTLISMTISYLTFVVLLHYSQLSSV